MNMNKIREFKRGTGVGVRSLALMGVLLSTCLLFAATPSRANPDFINPEFWKQTSAAEVENMLAVGGDIQIVEPQYLWTPMHLAAAFARDRRIVELLLTEGADINARDVDGAQPLHFAAGFNTNNIIIALLLGRGADMESEDNNGFTPLHWAAGNATDTHTTTLLLNRGANLEARSRVGLTPILSAANFSKSEALVRLLFKRGADITVQTERGRNIIDLLEDNEALKSSDTRHEIEYQLGNR